ncbi:carbamate kinase [Actinomyces bowdenii]|uniref:Carbamate kinase n=1 Tax=Actinomyces bowdenii TaxID=131109 RepID=A0A3P1V7L6_9ACTO|nr:carbamate kinase [Actinomyces bowdenii]RRD30194.1 carbamate kinase [Actinomyces bowdenii]
MSSRALVIAVGGNALIKDPGEVSVASQAEAVRESAEHITALIAAGRTPVVTHGNGPQVGFLLRRAELALDELPPLPLDVLGADTQGATGYLFSRSLRGCLAQQGIEREVVAVVTQSVVDPDDPAFAAPSKPVGSFMSQEEAREHEEKDGWSVREDSGRGWRRVVPSPAPVEIVECEVIRSLVDSGCIVVAAGGGGIPVSREDGRLNGVEAVIDKDLASALLASRLGVPDLVICTAVEQVYLDFGTPEQRALSTITAQEARSYLEEGHFGKGSMAPKIEAALNFLEAGGERAIITSLESLQDAVAGRAGTCITN